MFYLNTIVQSFLFVEWLDQLEVCLPYSRLLTGIPILVVFQNLGWNSNKTSLNNSKKLNKSRHGIIVSEWPYSQYFSKFPLRGWSWKL